MAERSQVDQRVSVLFEVQVPRLKAFKPKQQALELVFPCERSLNRESRLVDVGVKEAFWSRFRLLAIALVLRNVGCVTKLVDFRPPTRRSSAPAQLLHEGPS